ncbi:MAG: FGGY-family carbohydrate kinase, partial [Sphingomonadaceae bacterium]|nr:FGGY-family carbohydrate kinase [Sphingomonadaceae bacterium]
ADMLGIKVERPQVIETTAMGAAMLAGVGAGLFASLQEAQSMWRTDRTFEPSLAEDVRAARRAGWHRAVERVLA